jgi:hypothetical protein
LICLKQKLCQLLNWDEGLAMNCPWIALAGERAAQYLGES